MARPPELRSETFTRWAKAIWPNLVGTFGIILITYDCILNPPPDATSTIGIGLIVATGFVKLNRHDKAHPDDE